MFITVTGCLGAYDGVDDCRKMRKPTPVVHPDWLVQSTEAGKLLSMKPFLYRGFSDPTQSSIMSLSANSILRLSASNNINSSSGSPFSLASPLSASSAATPVKSNSVAHATDSASTVASGAISLGRGESMQRRVALNEQSAQPAFSDGSGGDGENDEGFSDSEDDQNQEVLQQMPSSTAMTPSTTTSRDAAQLAKAPHGSSGDARSKSTRDGPEFVRHYFAKSRLHHIGNWRTTFQQKAAEFLSIYKGPAIQRESPTSRSRVILHVDMDCFFVAVAVRERPELQRVPVAVAHSGNSGGTSEISSCNYLARAKGVRAGMFMQAAKELCPGLVVLPYKFEEIEQVSLQICTIFFSHTPYVQAMSCDEALLEFGSDTDGVEKAKLIREQIFAQSRCPASVGVSYNILLAKLASKQAKPDGMFRIDSPERAEPFLLSLAIRDLPGVGRRMSAKLEEMGLEDIQQLRSLSKGELVHHFGKTTGEMLFNFARGTDHRALSIESNMMRKSVSAVVNFGIRFEKWDDVTAFLMALAEELRSRLQSLKVRTQCLTLLIKKRREGEPVEPWKYMGHGVCDSFSRSQVLAEPTDDDQVIGKVCIELLQQLHLPTSDLRGVGVQATKLVGEPTATGGKKTRQLFKNWLSEPSAAHQRGRPLPVIQESTEDGDASTADETDEEKQPPAPTASTRPITAREVQIGLSQVNMSILDELPPWVRDEVLSTYRPHSTQAHGNLPQTGRQHVSTLPLGSKGKKPLQKPARNTLNLFNPLSNASASARHQHSGAIGNALNDIRMSQIDSDVYYALPLSLRKEIDRHAKRSKASSSVVAHRHHLPASPGSKAQARERDAGLMEVSKPLQSIEELFQSLLETVCSAVQMLDTVVDVDEGDHHLLLQTSQNQAFDSLYSRILLEVENRALDHALRMLRYVRRKCQSANEDDATLSSILRSGFNRVLVQVNRDIRHHFRGVLSSAVITPL